MSGSSPAATNADAAVPGDGPVQPPMPPPPHGGPSERAPVPRKRTAARTRLSDATATIVAALISAIVPSVVTYFVARPEPGPITDDAARQRAAMRRMLAGVRAAPGYTVHAVPQLGIALLAPDRWTRDSTALAFGSGEFDMIRDFDRSGSISQGIKFRIAPVQSTYVNAPQAEEANKLQTLRASIDASATVAAGAISQMPARVFSYSQRTGERVGTVRVYWARLAPRAKLEVIVFSNLDARDEFFAEAEKVLASVYVDRRLASDREPLP